MNIKLFAQTAYERHRIYLLKKYGAPKPWTDDKIFQNWFFCCTFRHLDKTSQWIIKNIIEPNSHRPDLWKSIIVSRYISRISTLEKLTLFSFKRMYNLLRTMQINKEKIVTNAFVCNSGIGNGQFVDKVSYIFLLLKNIQKKLVNLDCILKNATTLVDVYSELLSFPGVGPFMAYQYVCDFKYSKRYLQKTTDDETWCSLGLGAKRGMRRLLFSVTDKGDVNYTDIIEVYEKWKKYIKETSHYEIHKTLEILKKYGAGKLDIYNEYVPFFNLKLCHVQHWLCEYDKYCRGGSKKRSYNGSQ